MCCAAVVDTLVLLLLIHLLTEAQTDFLKALFAAVSIALFDYLVSTYLLSPMGAVALFVGILPLMLIATAVIWIVFEVQPVKALIIGGILIGYKVILLILLVFVLMAAGIAIPEG